MDVAAGPLFDIWGFGFSTDSLPSGDKVFETLAACGMSRLRPAIAPGVPADSRSLVSSSESFLTSSPSSGPALDRLSSLSPSGSTLGQFPSLSSSGSTFDRLSSLSSSESTLDRLSSLSSPESTLNSPLGSAPALLNFNAVAQGYTCDLVADYLRSIGVSDMLVDIGEIYCAGLNPAGRDWTIGVDRPVDGNETPGADLDGIWLSGGRSCGIVTSGNYRKFYVRDGRKYAHTIDPRTGYPVEHSLLSATIVASTAAAADAYATYCMVIGFDEARAFIESRPDLEGYLIRDADGTMLEWASPGDRKSVV